MSTSSSSSSHSSPPSELLPPIHLPNLSISRVDADYPDLHRMIALLDEDLLQRYPPEDIHGVDFTDPLVREMTFVVAYDGDRPIGCGGIRPYRGANGDDGNRGANGNGDDRGDGDDVTELKRFFVHADYRKRGAASRMLAALEQAAQEQGFRRIWLETGAEQPESLSFYHKFGYRPIPRFGEYAEYESSLCFGKEL